MNTKKQKNKSNDSIGIPDVRFDVEACVLRISCIVDGVAES